MLRYHVKDFSRDPKYRHLPMRTGWFLPNPITGHVPVLAQAFRIPDGPDGQMWMVPDPAINYRTYRIFTRTEAFLLARQRQHCAIVDACHALADIDALDRATE